MKRVLIVEDDPIIANIYQRKLQIDGFQVQHAADGELAMEVVGKNPPDIVLLDLQLPKANGIEVLKFIRSRDQTRKLPVVVFTNSYLGTLVQSAWKAGANKCLTKAICTPKQVSDVLKATLADPDGSAPAADSPDVAIPVSGLPAPDAPIAAGAAGTKPGESGLSRLLKMVGPAKPSAEIARPVAAPASAPAAKDAGGAIPFSPGLLPTPGAPAASAHGDEPLRIAGLPAPAPGGAQAAPAPPSANPATLLEMEESFQSELRRGFVETLPQSIAQLRQRLQAFTKNENDTGSLHWMEERSALIFDMFRRTHSLTSGAGVAGCALIAKLSAVFEAMLTELTETPKSINPSIIRTIARTVDCLAQLAAQVDAPKRRPLESAKILVVDDEPFSRKAVVRGLEKAELKAVDIADPQKALELLKQEHFEMVFLDIDMPGMDGHDLCKQLRGLPGYAKTPVIFVTGLTDFGSRAKSTMSGGNDLIAKPFLTIELAVKSLTTLITEDLKAVAR